MERNTLYYKYVWLIILTIFSMTTNAQFQSGHAPVNGMQMYYEVHGEGAIPLVLIHGGGSTIDANFKYLLPILAAHRKVIAVELQAHGRTSDRNAQPSFQQDADDIATLMHYLHVDKADILGFSSGAIATLQVAIRHPEIVNKIVEISGAYRRNGYVPGFFDAFNQFSMDAAPADLQEEFLKVNPDSAKMRVMFERDVYRMSHLMDWSDEDLKGIKCPTMIISADRDIILPEHSIRMAGLISRSQLVILPGIHGQVLGSADAQSGKGQTEILASLVEGFLN
jgi:pimeloyl-ACP methyl ester carboxylesterase